LADASRQVELQTLLLLLLLSLSVPASAGHTSSSCVESPERLRELAAVHPGRTGVYLLEDSSEALAARVWMVESARHSIDLQAFLWKPDESGLLFADLFSRAAKRGVRVRILLDGFGPKPPPELLKALSGDPNLEVRIYNPIGTGKFKVLDIGLELLFRFRKLNHRMHNKKLLMDRFAAITGGRNLADEYFGRSPEYDFTDRDAFLAGAVVRKMQESFEAFWASPRSVPAEDLWRTRRERPLRESRAQGLAGEIGGKTRGRSEKLQENFCRRLGKVHWTNARFISDRPENYLTKSGLSDRGATALFLTEILGRARERIVIQSPYFVLAPEELSISEKLSRGVEVKISTSSLASTDNITAFSGYRNQRDRLLRDGIVVREYKPKPADESVPVTRPPPEADPPRRNVHAKTAVVDGRLLFVSAFNFDPRSVYLNTEEGVLIEDRELASAVERRILSDLEPENSWNPQVEDPDRHAGFLRRLKLWFFRLLPLRPLL
jgi:cardiolipin synthase C